MSVVQKIEYVALDMHKTTANNPFEIVEGDTGNIIEITLTDRGVPVDLTGTKVLVIFSKGGVPVEQDTDGHGVTIEGDAHNIIRVELYSTSYQNGSNSAEVQVWSGDDYSTLVTSAWFKFTGRRARSNNATMLAVPEWPLLGDALNKLNGIVRGTQADYDQTNSEDPAYIKNKPVVGEDIQAATQALTTVTDEIADTSVLPVYDTTHKKITWAQMKSWLALLFAPLTHAARHATGGVDAISPDAIGAARKSAAAATVTLSAVSWSDAQYTVAIAGLAANANFEVLPSMSITLEQLTAAQSANIIVVAQAAGTFTLKAFGIVPTIDIPVLVIVRGDFY